MISDPFVACTNIRSLLLTTRVKKLGKFEQARRMVSSTDVQALGPLCLQLMGSETVRHDTVSELRD